MTTEKIPYKIYLSEDEMPKAWYNVRADMPTKPAPLLNPATGEPCTAEELGHVFCDELVAQELDNDNRYIPIPQEIRDFYKMYRPSPLVRAYCLEEKLGTPAKIYYKFEGNNTSGSHKLNSAIAQAYYAKKQGLKGVTTETGAGQWGTALSMACGYLGLDCKVYMVKCSYEQKPFRREVMRTYGASVTPSPSDTTAVVAYDGVELVVADQPMNTLVMGETELELFLRPDESLLARLGEDYQPAFTATLSNWMEDASDTPDTLVLAVSQEDLAQAEDAAFTWDFNGTVYKKLAASGIDYLVLQVGDQVTALSTAGFAAGGRYTMYRAQGLSSEAFDYHVAMTEEGETTLSVTVAGETWLLTEEEGGAFYYYDVYTGTLEELAQAKEG